MRKIVLIVCCCLSSLLMQAQRIVFTPQWLPQAQFAGFYVAMEKGFYKEAGLDVVFEHPSNSYSALNRIFDGSSDVITMHLAQAINAIDKGYPLVNILQLHQHNSTMIIPRNDSIQTIEDLQGKRLGLWRSGFAELAMMLLARHKIDIEWVFFLQGINLYVSGAIDAMLGMSYNEYWSILASGKHPSKVFRMSDFGIDIPNDGIYVTKEYYDAHPEQMKAFAQASKRGWEWTFENPEEALELVMKVMKKLKVNTNIHHQRWMLREILVLMCDEMPETDPSLFHNEKIEVKGNASYKLKPEHLQMANDMLLEQHQINRPVLFKDLWRGEE